VRAVSVQPQPQNPTPTPFNPEQEASSGAFSVQRKSVLAAIEDDNSIFITDNMSHDAYHETQVPLIRRLCWIPWELEPFWDGNTGSAPDRKRYTQKKHVSTPGHE
jgi:hypothetical protein